MKKSTKKQILNISFVVFMALVTFIALLSSSKELNYANLEQFFRNCNPFYILIAFLCWVGFVLFEALSLHIILKKLRYKSKAHEAIAYATSDTYYSAITPSASGGQPASAYYMIKNDIPGGVAGFSLIFNLIGYTAAILIIGFFAFVFGFNIFSQIGTFSKVLIIFGFVIQILLLLFFIACMCYHKAVLKYGKLLVVLFNKIKIIKNKEKWLTKVENIVDRYRNCYKDFKRHKKMLIPVLLCNVAQRVSQLLISVFVCMSAINCNFFDILIMQSLVMLGYNSIPLPGGLGIYEYLYLQIYCISFDKSFVIISMMVTRIISYYFSLIASGAYTMVYHMIKIKKKEIKTVSNSVEMEIELSK